jgi:hypothetical protein
MPHLLLQAVAPEASLSILTYHNHPFAINYIIFAAMPIMEAPHLSFAACGLLLHVMEDVCFVRQVF